MKVSVTVGVDARGKGVQGRAVLIRVKIEWSIITKL